MKYVQEMEKWVCGVFERVGAKGPDPVDYPAVNLAFDWVHDNIPRDLAVCLVERLIVEPHRKYRQMCDEHVPSIRTRKIGSQCYDFVLHIWDKPYGHPGDGDLLQKMYDLIDNPQDGDNDGLYCSKWDWYIASKPEILSLKHRREMFMTVMNDLKSKGAESLLDVGCGRGNFSGMWREHNPIGSFGKVIGVDMDTSSIEYATARYPGNTYLCRNILKHELPEGSDVIFSSGMFDYFTDLMFVRVLRKLRRLSPKYILLGNIGQSYPTKKMMSCIGWDLYDRSRFDLGVLAGKALPDSNVDTFSDRTGCQNWVLIEVNQ